MKIIVKFDEENKGYFKQYSSQMESLLKNFAALEINKSHLKLLRGITKGFEEVSLFKLKEQCEPLDASFLQSNNAILAFIGPKQVDSSITHYYDITHSALDQIKKDNVNNSEQQNSSFTSNLKIKHDETITLETTQKKYYINCISQNNTIDSVDFLRCISFLTNLSNEINKPFIIYANIEIDPTNKPKKLFYEIATHYLKASTSMLIIPSHLKHQPSNDIRDALSPNVFNYILKDKEGFNSSLRTALSLLKSFPNKPIPPIEVKGHNKREINHTRQDNTLFNDYSYLSIDPDEEIYVPLITEAATLPAYFKDLGFEYIKLETGLSVLYGKRSAFDEHREQLKSYVPINYRFNIMTHAPCVKDRDKPMLPYFLPPAPLKLTGKGVYIGIITSDDIDYTNKALRNKDGTTRIAFIWEQVRTTQGNTYTAQQINEALASPNPDELIKLPVGESMSTVIAAISGGFDEEIGYWGISPNAEFIIAKIRPISENLQRIYGGMPNPKAIILFDALLGMFELANFALKENKPLSLIMPFNSNLDAHDALQLTQQEVPAFASRTGLTLIIPTGDEGDKQHHSDLTSGQPETKRIELRVSQPNQNVVGVIYQWGNNLQTIKLYPPNNPLEAPINLKIAANTQFGNVTVYSSGEQISFTNGALYTYFRLENPTVGNWIIEAEITIAINARSELWISQEELNPYITLHPSNAINTMGSNSTIPNIMSVGGFNASTSSVIASSGRGNYPITNNKPTLVTYGKSILAPCSANTWVGTTSTVAAASTVVGVAANIYQDYLDKGLSPLPNTVVMNSIIISKLTQFESVSYPNLSQGYGVLLLTGPY